jgi:hypothetical protein
MNSKKTDYEVELERIDEAIAGFAGGAFPASADSERATKFVYLLYQHASLTGNLAELAGVETALDDAIRDWSCRGPLFSQGQSRFQISSAGRGEAGFETGRDLRDSLQGKPCWRPRLQEGRYEAARKGYEAAIQDNLTWDNLSPGLSQIHSGRLCGR